MDYLKNELKVKCTSFKQSFKVINSRLFVAWTFGQSSDTVNGQLYTATICYDQVLVINVLLLKKPSQLDKAHLLTDDIASTIKLYTLP